MHTPVWYFKFANLNLAAEITKEFQKSLPIVYPEFDILTSQSTYKQTPNNIVKDAMPLLSKVLKDEGLYDTWTSTSFIVTHSGALYRPHIDKPATETTPARVFALNWPIYNCDTSVTSFYKVPSTINKQKVHIIPNVGERLAYFTNMSETILELVDSLTINQPTWLRVDIPHGVRVTSKNTRLIASLRFTPEPYKYLGLICPN